VILACRPVFLSGDWTTAEPEGSTLPPNQLILHDHRLHSHLSHPRRNLTTLSGHKPSCRALARYLMQPEISGMEINNDILKTQGTYRSYPIQLLLRVLQQMLQDAYWCPSVPVVLVDQGTWEISKIYIYIYINETAPTWSWALVRRCKVWPDNLDHRSRQPSSGIPTILFNLCNGRLI